ncbi:MAG: ATP-binding protein, partial [Chloroflexota bacterium]
QTLADDLETKLIQLNFSGETSSLEAYRVAAEQNQRTFIQAASFIFILTDPTTGLEHQLDKSAGELADLIQTDPLLFESLNQLRGLEREYYILRKPASMDYVFNQTDILRSRIEQSSLAPSARNNALKTLDIYVAIAEEIVAVDLNITSLADSFNQSAEPLQQASSNLISFSNVEFENAQTELQRISYWVLGGTIVLSVAAISVAYVAVGVLRRNITPQIISLTKIAKDYQDGDFSARSRFLNLDEIGLLGRTFDQMAEKISGLLQDLEYRNHLYSQVNEELNVELFERERIQMSLEANQVRLKQYAADLEQSNEELEEFAYVVSHDLRAPLRGIASLSSWLEMDYADSLDEGGHEMLSLMNNRVRRLEALIEGILEFSRVGRQETRKTEVDLSQLMDDVLDNLAPNDNFKLNIQPDLPIVFGERLRLMQVFQNLIDNAIKYSDPQKAENWVKLTCKKDNDQWVFCISDNGLGIDSKYHKKVFQIFQTLSIDEEQNAESTGVGLSLVRKIIQLHGGRIWIESIPGEGSQFLFTLPRENDGTKFDVIETMENEDQAQHQLVPII